MVNGKISPNSCACIVSVSLMPAPLSLLFNSLQQMGGPHVQQLHWKMPAVLPSVVYPTFGVHCECQENCQSGELLDHH